jgi:serine/threonine-protein kinase
VNPGTVLSQDPAAAQSVNRGAAVNIQVSLDTVTVPDVRGAKQADAESTIKAAGFLVTVTAKASSSVASGRVIDQNPTGGVTAQTGSTVGIVVSTGPDLIAVPDVGTMTQASAVNALTAAGFKSQVVLQTGGGTVGTVVAQSPLAGVKAASGSTVKITVVQ